jgi:hypothetical protein
MAGEVALLLLMGLAWVGRLFSVMVVLVGLFQMEPVLLVELMAVEPGALI